MSDTFFLLPPLAEMELLKGDVPGTEKYRLAGGETRMLKGHFGQVFCSHVAGNDFDIRLHSGNLELPVGWEPEHPPDSVLFVTPWSNEITIDREGIGEVNISTGQYSIGKAGRGKITIGCKGPGQYQVFTVMFSKELLQPYAFYSPALGAVIEQVLSPEQDHLQNSTRFLTLDMIRLLHKVAAYKEEARFASLYFTGLLHQLLTLITIQFSLLQNAAISADDLENAQVVRQIINHDFEEYPTVEELAKKVGSSKDRLQAAFQHLYGQTVGTFSREARLEKAYQILTETTYPLRVVCLMVGYPDASNFSVAFKKQYGFWPGKIQKKKQNH